MYCILCYEFGKEATHVATNVSRYLLKVLHREGFGFCFVWPTTISFSDTLCLVQVRLRPEVPRTNETKCFRSIRILHHIRLEILVTRLVFLCICVQRVKSTTFSSPPESHAICESQYHPFIFYVTRMEILMI